MTTFIVELWGQFRTWIIVGIVAVVGSGASLAADAWVENKLDRRFIQYEAAQVSKDINYLRTKKRIAPEKFTDIDRTDLEIYEAQLEELRRLQK